MALITDIQVFMLVRQTAKHHSVISSHYIYHQQYSDSLDIVLDFCFFLTENHLLHFVNTNHLNILVNLRQQIGLVTSISSEHETPEWKGVCCKFLTNQRIQSD